MKDRSKDSLNKADKKDKTVRDNVETLKNLQSFGLFTHLTEEDVQSDLVIDELLAPYDIGEKELPDAIARDIQKDPYTGRFTSLERMKSIWLMSVMQDKEKVPLYKIVKIFTGFGVKTLQHWWKNRQKWIEWNNEFTNTSLKVIKMTFITALLKAATALNSIDYNRLAASKDPRDHANLLKMVDGLATRIQLADSLLAQAEATASTEAIEGTAGVSPVAPAEIILPQKGVEKKDEEPTSEEQSKDQ